MLSIKRLLVFVLCLLLCTPVMSAQDQQGVANGKTLAAQDLTIIIQQQQVIFTTPIGVEEMRLQVFDQNGEAVFDSQPLAINQLSWFWQGTDGNSVKSGLYAYTLTLKEAGLAGTMRIRRGHFIVDRASERDAQADRIWLTGQDGANIGTEVTVARNSDAVIAGTRIPVERTALNEGLATVRSIEEKATPQGIKPDFKAATALSSGTVGQIAKFTSATDVGNSVMIEKNGNIGVGLTSFSSTAKFEVNGSMYLTTTGSGGNVSFGTPNGETGIGFRKLTGIARADIRFDETSLKIVAGKVDGGPPSSLNGIAVNVSGNVGIGTVSPTTKLEIAGSAPILTLQDTNTGGKRSYIQSANGNLAFFPHSFVGTSGAMIIRDSANAGSRVQINGQDALTLAGSQPFLTLQDTGANNRRGFIQSANGDLGFIPHSFVGNGTGMLIRDSANAGSRVEISGQDALNMVGYQPFLTLTDSGAGNARGAIQQIGGGLSLIADSSLNGANPGAYLRLDNSGNVGIGTSAPQSKLDVAGQTRTESLEITGGADFAENFDVSTLSSKAAVMNVEAGMVVAIDPINPGKLTLTTQAYDRRVAGIISGAGGVNPGMRMSQAGTLANGQYPVALSGRVYCWVDATQGAIEPGDFLTASNTPGHAMKVMDSAKAQGTIIGKAMTGLKKGKGLVLVLVTLQ